MSEQLLHQILDEMKGLKVAQQSTNDRLDRIDVRLDTIDGRLDGIDARLDAMDARFDGIDVRLDGMAADIKELKADHPLMKQAILETNEIVKRIEATQERHDLTLDILSRRSIDQEAFIKRIK